MAYEINKPTLQDFINNSNAAIRKGYYHRSMSCLALKGSYFDLSDFVFLKLSLLKWLEWR